MSLLQKPTRVSVQSKDNVSKKNHTIQTARQLESMQCIFHRQAQLALKVAITVHLKASSQSRFL